VVKNVLKGVDNVAGTPVGLLAMCRKMSSRVVASMLIILFILQ
jgi:hypothetical protein